MKPHKYFIYGRDKRGIVMKTETYPTKMAARRGKKMFEKEGYKVARISPLRIKRRRKK